MMRISERLEVIGIAAVAISMAAYFTIFTSHVTRPGLPLDDSWIHMQFARNLGTGHGFSYNPGVPSSGSTAPLWTLLLAIPAFLHLDLQSAAKVLGVALIISAALTAREVVKLLTNSRLAATMSGLAVVLSARMTWASLSGMEVPLYTTLAMLTLLTYLRGLRTGRATLWGGLAGLTGTARPELFLFIPVFVLHWAWWHRKQGAIQSAIRPSIAAGVVVAAYIAFNYTHGGQPLPGTFYAKTTGLGLVSALIHGQWRDVVHFGIGQPIQYFNILLHWGDEQTPFLTLAALVGALVLIGALPLPGADMRGGGMIVALFLLAPMLRGALVPTPPLLTQNGRYIGHVLIMYFMIGSIGLTYLWTATRKHWGVAIFIVLTFVRLASQDVKFATRFAAEVKNINDLQIVTAEWIRARTTPDVVVATNDIGAMAFFGQRTIIDTEGLVTPEAVPYEHNKSLDKFVEKVKPDLLVIFPGWYPYLVARTDLLHEVGHVTALKVVAGGESLVIYRLPWTRADTVPGVPLW